MTDRESHLRVGIIGLGVMGAAMARRILAAGHPLMVSSASRGVSLKISGAIFAKSSAARSSDSLSNADTICGMEKISSSANPCATRSGQNATATPGLALSIFFRTISVTPGNTVLRKITSWPACISGRY